MRWWLVEIAFRPTKTGNPGAKPERPRRCDRATRMSVVGKIIFLPLSRRNFALLGKPAVAPSFFRGEKANLAGPEVRRPTNAWHAVSACEGQPPRCSFLYFTRMNSIDALECALASQQATRAAVEVRAQEVAACSPILFHRGVSLASPV